MRRTSPRAQGKHHEANGDYQPNGDGPNAVAPQRASDCQQNERAAYADVPPGKHACTAIFGGGAVSHNSIID
jgi:hypothetical protein